MEEANGTVSPRLPIVPRIPTDSPRGPPRNSLHDSPKCSTTASSDPTSRDARTHSRDARVVTTESRSEDGRSPSLTKELGRRCTDSSRHALTWMAKQVTVCTTNTGTQMKSRAAVPDRARQAAPRSRGKGNATSVLQSGHRPPDQLPDRKRSERGDYRDDLSAFMQVKGR